MRGTFFNAGSSLSIGIFFSLMIAGLAATLPSTLFTGLIAHHVPAALATRRRERAAGRQPVRGVPRLQPGADAARRRHAGQQLPAADRTTLTGREFFPNLISQPFHHGLVIVFAAAIAMSVIGAVASLVRGRRYVHGDVPSPRPLSATTSS